MVPGRARQRRRVARDACGHLRSGRIGRHVSRDVLPTGQTADRPGRGHSSRGRSKPARTRPRETRQPGIAHRSMRIAPRRPASQLGRSGVPAFGAPRKTRGAPSGSPPQRTSAVRCAPWGRSKSSVACPAARSPPPRPGAPPVSAGDPRLHGGMSRPLAGLAQSSGGLVDRAQCQTPHPSQGPPEGSPPRPRPIDRSPAEPLLAQGTAATIGPTPPHEVTDRPALRASPAINRRGPAAPSGRRCPAIPAPIS